MNSIALDKRQIERQFERAASSYNKAAELQQDIILELLSAVGEFVGTTNKIADLGCGTGLGLVELERRFPSAQLLGVDIAQAMLEQASQACLKAEMLKADIETLPEQNQSLDLVFTTSTLQWCNLDAALKECARVLRPGGYLALSTFGPKTHQEWKAAWESVDGVTHTLDFTDQATIENALKCAGLAPLKQWMKTHRLRFETTHKVLQSVKHLGATNANAERQRGLMGKQRFQRFLRAFEQISPDNGLTYEVFFAIARMPE